LVFNSGTKGFRKEQRWCACTALNVLLIFSYL
jgi:hypothetical protein